MVVSCNKCGKKLSTQQALDYHLRNVKCDTPHPSENEKKKLNLNDYDITFICNFYGTIINIFDDSKIVINATFDLHDGMDIYKYIHEQDYLIFMKTHLNVVKNRSNHIIYIRLCSLEQDNTLYVTCYIHYDENENIVINCKRIDVDKENSLFFILDKDGHIEYVNENVIYLLGWNKTDFLGKEFLQYLSDIDIRTFCNIIYTLNTYKYIKNKKISMVTKQGYLKKLCIEATLHDNLIFMSAHNQEKM